MVANDDVATSLNATGRGHSSRAGRKAWEVRGRRRSPRVASTSSWWRAARTCWRRRRPNCATEHGVEVRTLSVDITSPDLLERLDEVTHDLDIGMLVHNVGSTERNHGWFLDDSLDVTVKTIEVNCIATAKLAHTYARGMRDRGRGGIVFMGSLTGMAGQPLEATYSAAKAFSQVFAEALWSELGERGVDVVSVPLGGTRTPALEAKGMLEDRSLADARRGGTRSDRTSRRRAGVRARRVQPAMVREGDEPASA